MSSVNAKKRIKDLLDGTLATTNYYGFGDLAVNTDDIISEIYTSPTYSDADRANLVTWFAANPITVLPEFPRTVKDLPAVFIARVGDTESSKGILGDYFDEDLDDEDIDTIVRGTYFDETITLTLWCSSGGGGQRDDIYLALREIVIRGMDYLHLADIITPEWKNGVDGQMFDPEARPQVIHTAKATITYRVAMTWEENARKIKDIQSNLSGYNGGGIITRAWTDIT